MSEEHKHGGDDKPLEPAAKPHDSRLDAGGEDHPGVKPLPFDLIALENTRLGLRILGLALGLVSIAVPLVVGTSASTDGWASRSGWVLTALGFLFMILGVTIAAPTPHGPLPGIVRVAVIFMGIVSALSALVHGLVPKISYIQYVDAATDGIAPYIDEVARVLLLTLPWILWRFCQYRGLTGRAIVWLWIAMASSALTIAAFFSGLGWLLFGFPALGVIAFFAAQHTARDVWQDAIYRNTKFHATNRPNAVVEPLRPAGDR